MERLTELHTMTAGSDRAVEAAKTLVTTWFLIKEAAPRTKLLAVRTAEFAAKAQMLNVIGAVRTPAAVHLDMIDALALVEVDRGPRPPFHSVNNRPQREWDISVAETLSNHIDL